MAFIDGFEDVMRQLEKTIAYVMKSVAKNCAEDLKKYNAEVPKIKNVFPRLKLTEALEVLKREFGKEIEGIDIDPEGERLICEWVKKKYKSDFVFLTHYPASLRPFYTMPSADPQFTESFDLLFRGLEITTGGQRINDYEQLVNNIKKFGLNPEDYKDYLSASAWRLGNWIRKNRSKNTWTSQYQRSDFVSKGREKTDAVIVQQ